MPVRSYGTAEEDEFMQECDVLLIVGPKSDEMLQYYRDLAKFYNKLSKWASPKE
jgi:thiamine pyrophosphate-dependent acetolactate synthase large subunit-like protein